jgi:MFS transporter, FHS family, glucose/mannose:H+ symporter
MTHAHADAQIRTGWLSAASFAGMFGFGVVMALLGAILPLISQSLRFDLAQAGGLFLVMNGAMLATTFALGPLLDRFGIKPAFLLAPLFVAGALTLIANTGTFAGLQAGVILLGIGGGALNQATNTLIADLHEDARRKGAALNLLGVFFGFGGLFVPFTIGTLLGVLGLAKILYLAAALTLTTTAMSVALAFPAPRQSAGVSMVEVLRLARQPLIVTLAVLLFLESGNEFVLGGYMTSYLTRSLGATVPIASILLAVYWGALMFARVVLSRVLLHVSGHVLTLASAAGVAASVSVLVGVPSLLVAGVAIVVLGLSIAAIFPTTLGLAGARYPSHSGTAFGILIGISLTGGMTLPWVVGRIADRSGLAAGLAIPIASAAGIFGLQWIAGQIITRRDHAN